MNLREEILTIMQEIVTLEHRAPSTEHRAPSTEPQDCPLISIIVPVYNCGKFIAKALDSLINQDIPTRNYEIIITDDGSTDDTPAICDTYAAQHSFIHVTHTENFGASHARNVALPQCRGEYITFCDADDAVSPQLISVLSKAIALLHEPDIVHYGHFVELPANGWSVYDVDNIKASEADCISAETLAVRCAGYVGGYIWNKVFRSELAKSVRFDESVKASEDSYWLMNVLANNNSIRVYCIPYLLYHYIQHPNFGQTRSLSRIYDEYGMRRSIRSYQRSLAIPTISPLVAEQFHGKIYAQSVYSLWLYEVDIHAKAYNEFRYFMKKYARDYYLKYQTTRFTVKVKNFIKHILILMHIRRPRRY